jgi:hypothetical protein
MSASIASTADVPEKGIMENCTTHAQGTYWLLTSEGPGKKYRWVNAENCGFEGAAQLT